MNRYHIQRGETRTTVTLDSTICELLALKLGMEPDARDSHKVVRSWLQSTSEQEDKQRINNLSQWLKRKAILHIADNSLLAKHHQWKEEIDRNWDAELAKRVAEVDSGKVKMIPKDEVFKAVREQLS